MEQLRQNRESSFKDHQRFVKELQEQKLKGLQTKFKVQTVEEYDTLRKLHQLQLEEREMIKVRKQKYGELVRENYKPPVSERKKSERIAHIISPRQLRGTG